MLVGVTEQGNLGTERLCFKRPCSRMMRVPSPERRRTKMLTFDGKAARLGVSPLQKDCQDARTGELYDNWTVSMNPAYA